MLIDFNINNVVCCNSKCGVLGYVDFATFDQGEAQLESFKSNSGLKMPTCKQGFEKQMLTTEDFAKAELELREERMQKIVRPSRRKRSCAER